VAAVYVPRIFLESFAHGIQRTYLYELLDPYPDPERDDPASNFGLLRHDYSRKPAANALANLLTLIGGEDMRPHATGALPIMIEAKTDDVGTLLLQSADGTYWLALWRLLSVYDVDSAAKVDIAPAKVTVVLDEPARVNAFRPVDSVSSLHRADAATRVDLWLAADAQLVALTAPAGVE
jgi:hypothetical protein